MTNKQLKTWTTREGVVLDITQMTTPHLLMTIHMIERKRMENLVSLGVSERDENIIDYYARWPDSYEDLLQEAERRFLIKRAKQYSTSLVRKKK